MRRTIQRALLIVLAGGALGLVANAISTRGIPYIAPPKPRLQARDTVPLHEAQELWRSGTTFFLDARSPADYAAGHIANAFSLPVEDFDQQYPRVATLLTPDSSIVVYCDGQQCDLSHRLMVKLSELGYRHVRVLVNGWTVWQTAGLPSRKGEQP
ncbi:MAG TPA: rhodanese-like domain-containing protein [Verrucomicrobiae bacterium]|nr:rhodanese-like domain-containing protein [Verrucomicrobiae bacterium]